MDERECEGNERMNRCALCSSVNVSSDRYHSDRSQLPEVCPYLDILRSHLSILFVYIWIYVHLFLSVYFSILR